MNIINVASAVIADDYSRILLLHRADGDFTHWELPGAIADDEYDEQQGEDDDTETPEQACVRGLYEALGVRAKLVTKLGTSDVELDDTTYRYHWFQASVAMGELQIADYGIYDDLDYFELEDLPSLALSDDILELYPKLYSGDIVLV